LDPGATGVLPVCLGKATKIADYIMAEDKEYIAAVVLGTATDTQDASGSIINSESASVTSDKILKILPRFIGEVRQVPPMYSAIKIKGKRLYEYARQGLEAELKARKVNIRGLEVLKWDLDKSPQSFVLRVDCSKGTYIRSLCADIGEALGTYAHMGRLLRTRSGRFGLHGSISLGRLSRLDLNDVIIPIEAALGDMPKVTIGEEFDKLLVNGNKIPFDDSLLISPCLVYGFDGRLAGIYRAEEGFLKPKTMLGAGVIYDSPNQ
jgi:tRNA pseudouridine55 synthase